MSPVWIADDSIIADRKASIKCYAAANIDLLKIKLGYKIFHKDLDVERSSVTGASFDWKKEGDLYICIIEVDVKDATLLQAFLSYGGIALHEWYVQDPSKSFNQNFVMHEVFDNQLKVLREILVDPDGNQKAQSFEIGVGLILSMLGFFVLQYGKVPNLTDGPDIIAATPNGNVLIVEATTGPINTKDKISKLARRTVLINKKLSGSGFGPTVVQPIMVTELAREEVDVDLKVASKHKIAVICREEIEELLRRITLSPNPEEYFKQAVELVPTMKELKH